MKKNRMMRLASILLVLTLISTCAISGTFAKYTTSVNSSDSARVATWGFTESTIDLAGLFDKTYKTGDNNDVVSTADVIAPGTEGNASFSFTYNGQETAPEVAYKFTVSVDGSSIDDSIKNNSNILWKLDDSGTYGTWADLMTAIMQLSGDSTAKYKEAVTTPTPADAVTSASKEYAPGVLPTGFNAKPGDSETISNKHTVYWKWVFDENATNKESATTNKDTADTTMGNATALDDVTIKITITATQLDSYIAPN